MKTRRNYRKTTTGRRKRHVKYRVQTRINHRRGTVSSGRRHKFFKRGGEPVINPVINPVIDPVIDPTIKMLVDGVENTVKTKLGFNSDAILDLAVDRVYSIQENNFKIIPNRSVIFEIDSKKISFRNLEEAPGKQSVYIDLYNPETMKFDVYGRIMVTIGKENMGSYFRDVAEAIFLALNTKRDYEKYKQKQ
jgi:hypothetical protein